MKERKITTAERIKALFESPKFLKQVEENDKTLEAQLGNLRRDCRVDPRELDIPADI